MVNRRGWLLGVAALGLLVGPTLAWEIPLTVREEWGQGGMRRVTGGVPLLVGQAKEASSLRLAVRDKEGRLTAIPAQFRVLARWWRADNSIRWVLVDFATNVGNFQAKPFILTTGTASAPAPALPIRVEETDEAVTVTTGPGRFVINRKRFAFLDHAFVDANSDGKFADDEDVLATTPEDGTVLEDAFGEKYYSSEGTKSVEVVERGPMRVCVRARGMHRARGGKGYSHGMYAYDVLMQFYAGSTDVNVDPIIGNNPPKSTGSPTFEDASLMMKLRGGATGYRLYGAAPLDGTLAEGESVCLYQDSNGAETWQRCKGHYGPQTVGFRGYRITRRVGGKETVITLVIVGKKADGIDPDLTPWQKESEEERPPRLTREEFARIFD